MKFLRLAYYVLIAQQVLSGCAGEGMDETSPSSSEINFDAYLGTNASTVLEKPILLLSRKRPDLVSLQDIPMLMGQLQI